MELGSTREALAELSKLPPQLANHPEVLEVRWTVSVAENDWAQALQLAEQLIQLNPMLASAWLHRAYALRRVKGGGVSAAWDALLPAVQKFPTEPTIPYNLACYACQLGQLEEARQWLLRARALSDRSRIKDMALADEDLKPFWAEVSKW